MAAHRFEITPVNELNQNKNSIEPWEIVPLIDIKNNIPTPPLLPPSLRLINEKNKSTPRLFHSRLNRKKPCASSMDLVQKNETSSLPNIHSKSVANLNITKETEEDDSVNSTVHSNTMDTNSLRLTNKFLQELRSKRRELHSKARNLSIDQRIALNRFQYDQNILRAQDIFDVHFELNDDDNVQYNVFTEDAQEKIRKNIFHELDRQRMKQYHKQHRHLIFGRALLMFITSLLAFMSITLIYVVVDLYDRANLNTNLTDIPFMPIILNNTNYE